MKCSNVFEDLGVVLVCFLKLRLSMPGEITRPVFSVTAKVGFIFHINASASGFPTSVFACSPQEVCSASDRPLCDSPEELRSADLFQSTWWRRAVQGSVVSAPGHDRPGQGSLSLGASIALTPLAFHSTNTIPRFFCNKFQFSQFYP